MEIINLEGTEDTPRVLFDPSKNIFEITGRSLPEDCSQFYGPLLKWLDGYVASPNANTIFEVKLEYFNTASSKMILDVLSKMEILKEAGKEVCIHWYSHDDDEDMQEAGEEFAELVEVPFEYKVY
jgi:hypothetical protein